LIKLKIAVKKTIKNIIGGSKISDIETFKDFVDRIIYLSRLKLDGGALTKAFVDEVRINSDNLHNFKRFCNSEFEKWRQERGSLVDVADFLIHHGADILNFWMTKVFCFNEKKLKIDVPKMLSPVDCQIIAQYSFSKDELKIIKALLQEYEVDDYDEKKAASTIFSNSLKVVSQYLSEIIDSDYKIFTNKLEYKEKKGQLFIDYEAAGRIQGL